MGSQWPLGVWLGSLRHRDTKVPWSVVRTSTGDGASCSSSSHRAAAWVCGDVYPSVPAACVPGAGLMTRRDRIPSRAAGCPAQHKEWREPGSQSRRGPGSLGSASVQHLEVSVQVRRGGSHARPSSRRL